MHARHVGMMGVEPRANGIVRVVLGGNEDHAAPWARRAVGPRRTGRDASRQVAGEEALAGAGHAHRQRDAARGDPLGPQPLDRPSLDVGHANQLRAITVFEQVEFRRRRWQTVDEADQLGLVRLELSEPPPLVVRGLDFELAVDRANQNTIATCRLKYFVGRHGGIPNDEGGVVSGEW